MFFVAGLSPKLKQIGNVAGECPACGARDKLFLIRQRQALSVFFIPVLQFGGGYLATCGQCASVIELQPQAGKRAEQDPGTVLSAHEMQVIKNNAGPRCSQCGRRIYPDQSYCPGCGQKL